MSIVIESDAVFWWATMFRREGSGREGGEGGGGQGEELTERERDGERWWVLLQTNRYPQRNRPRVSNELKSLVRASPEHSGLRLWGRWGYSERPRDPSRVPTAQSGHSSRTGRPLSECSKKRFTS